MIARIVVFNDNHLCAAHQSYNGFSTVHKDDGVIIRTVKGSAEKP